MHVIALEALIILLYRATTETLLVMSDCLTNLGPGQTQASDATARSNRRKRFNCEFGEEAKSLASHSDYGVRRAASEYSAAAQLFCVEDNT